MPISKKQHHTIKSFKNLHTREESMNTFLFIENVPLMHPLLQAELPQHSRGRQDCIPTIARVLWLVTQWHGAAMKGAKILHESKHEDYDKKKKEKVMAPKFPGWKPNYLHVTLIRSCWLAPAKLQPVKRLLILSPPGRYQSWGKPEETLPPEAWQRNRQWFFQSAFKKQQSLQLWRLCILPFLGLQVCNGLLHRLPARQDFETMLLMISFEDGCQSVGNEPQKADTWDKPFALCRRLTWKLTGQLDKLHS